MILAVDWAVKPHTSKQTEIYVELSSRYSEIKYNIKVRALVKLTVSSLLLTPNLALKP